MLNRIFRGVSQLVGLLKGRDTKEQGGLSGDEVALLHYLRTTSNDTLKGRDLVLARRMASSGHLRLVGDRRYAITEKGVVAYLAER